jgi:hypothetical protein
MRIFFMGLSQAKQRRGHGADGGRGDRLPAVTGRALALPQFTPARYPSVMVELMEWRLINNLQ